MPKKRKPKQNDWPVFYVVEIEDWSWSFSFGLNHDKRAHDPYSDYRHLEISGNLLHPSIAKADSSVVHLLPDIELDHKNRLDRNPIAVGSLELYDNVLRGLISIPLNSLDSLLVMLDAKRLCYLIMQGQKLRYRKTVLTNYRFERELNEDDYPLDD